MNASIRPFHISIADAKLDGLKVKLSHTTFADDVPMSNGWEFGPPLSDLKRLISYWREGFDWRAQEANINRLPHFTTPISVDGFGELNIHFIHKTSSREGVSLFCFATDTRPSSLLEVTNILPLLTNPKDSDGPSFHVVAPSLPNFGFSDAATKPGFGIAWYAECLHKLMLKLGYKEYVTQGRDWGYAITRTMGFDYAQHCIASHLNYIRANAPTPKQPLLYLQYLLPRTKTENAGLARMEWFMNQGLGYNIEQTTRPATIGAALAGSPMDDEILSWVSLYWLATAGPAASAGIYYEAQNTVPHPRHDERMFQYNPHVKLGLSYFLMGLLVFPPCYGRTLGPVVLEKVHTEGGHFAAYEKPELLVADLRAMFGRGGGAKDIAGRWKPAAATT
ncbi:Alpha/Beta hydrolase protein [Immersiella caudata]|uniref:Alpha/Beta hydrolase protein n=1 Tax=Immersiella caudata TaxID=314043 RepID=A0AA40BZH0_9PEZI|nr:Alpha/Beta hydrolase protein [Immersiella caudata]